MSRERDILDLIADAVIVTDDESVRVLEANVAAAELLGYERDELIGMALADLSAEPNASLKAFESRTISIPLRHYRRKDGRTVSLEITTMYGLWKGHRVHVATYRDVTAREEATQALMRSEERFRELVKNLGAGVAIVDPSEFIVFANEAAERTFGAPLGLVGRNLAEFTEEKEFARILQETAKRKHGERSTYDIWIRRPNGEERQLSVIATPQFDEKGTVTGTFGIFQDITEQAKLQQSLQRERNLLLTLINNLPDHIYLRDRQNRFILANKAVAEFMGAGDPEALIGKRDSDFYPPSVAAQFAADDRLILEEGKSIINQERCDRSASGASRWVMTTKVPVIDESGSVLGLVGIGRDFTESRETKEALQRSQEQLQQGLKMEAIGRLAGGIAHDFNNLLTVIKGFAELIDARLSEDDPSKAEIAEIRGASQRAARLTSQLLAFGRKQILQPRIIKLNDVVLAMRNMLPRILGEDIELSIGLGEGTGSIRADQGQLEQVIMNLAVNARDAMPHGGRLTIATDNCTIAEEMRRERPELRPGSYVSLAVIDTGTGMEAETLARIFEPFFTTKEPGKGTGLGLSTVYGIVKQSEGYIYCDSAPLRGTSFVIYFPRVFDESQEARLEGKPAGKISGSETVLLVEDEAALRGFVRSTLEKNGYTVIEARDGISALERLSRGDRAFDILVTDVVMPRMGGQELAQRVVQNRPSTRVLFMSGYAEEAIMPPPMGGVRVDLIRKPFDAVTFLARLREVLDRS
ncbi:MAG TPA: PAS domain S-box protein [Spirochaetia bacterium]|nr:PAS domain S-box protein [Spirochaetia bacterium]